MIDAGNQVFKAATLGVCVAVGIVTCVVTTQCCWVVSDYIYYWIWPKP